MSQFLLALGGIFSNPSFYFTVLSTTVPILLATLGCAIAESAGSTNMGMEGIMLMSAFAGVIGSAYTGVIWAGLLCAFAVGVVMGLMVAYFALYLKVDIILVGIAVNLIGSGLSAFLMYVLTGDRSATTSLQSGTLPTIVLPGVESIPFLGAVVSNQSVLAWVAYLMVPVLAFLLNKTTLGLRIRSVGEQPDAAASVGVGVNRTKTVALLISGLLGGLAGAYLSMSYLPYFTKGMSGGRGFTALAATAMAHNTPVGSLGTSLLFGFFYALSTYASSLGIPDQLVAALPYLATLVGLVAFSIGVQRKERARSCGVAADSVALP
ncbi:ABC transporter permease [Olsenella urininfantis]|uniref:ABC transporter permease n=1 Tax=Olsenella urininfantis TaxID=1871033 RepID=UPI0009855CF2|nr:ABC transporter permease [Olsenella urininfantis]